MEYSDFIEEKSPKGMTLKIFPKKSQFLVFDRRGKSVYSDDQNTKVLHRMQAVYFVGVSFAIRNTHQEFSLLKVIKNQMVLPYVDLETRSRKYLFLDTLGPVDIMPTRLRAFDNTASLVRETDATDKPDAIVVSRAISGNDIIVIKNRFPAAVIITAGVERSLDMIEESPAKSGADGEVNLNMMSTNPVFLARVHLRDMNVMKVNQIMLDFDLTAIEAEYILSFIRGMLKDADANPDIAKNRPKLESLAESLRFYMGLLNKDTQEVQHMIEALSDMSLLASYSTLITKVKLMNPERDNQLLYTDYENLVYEKKISK
ncbi:MAG: hypothetical protein EPN93_08135 [Spirochaetes bacterium]|nr:MAG: hypothetical protein EPN93_08135 [Spirochaetota bacterium]